MHINKFPYKRRQNPHFQTPKCGNIELLPNKMDSSKGDHPNQSYNLHPICSRDIGGQVVKWFAKLSNLFMGLCKINPFQSNIWFCIGEVDWKTVYRLYFNFKIFWMNNPVKYKLTLFSFFVHLPALLFWLFQTLFPLISAS